MTDQAKTDTLYPEGRNLEQTMKKNDTGSAANGKTMIQGSEMVIRSLIREGVTTIFGYPGGAIMPVYDSMLNHKIKHVLSRHEQGAAHMADGYARTTGKVGVCVATSGPGATNLITGLATAYMDSVPIVAITGQVGTGLLGTDGFQEADTYGLSFPITKHSYCVRRTEDIPAVIKEAFYIARTGRPGPVLIDLPKDVQQKTALYYPPEEEVVLPGYVVPDKVNEADLEAILAEVYRARKPVAYVGGGIISSGASDMLRRFLEKTEIPVTMTLMGLGAVPLYHPLSLGMLGMHGTIYANQAIINADLVLALGVRFDDRVTGRRDRFASSARIVHVDIDEAELGKNIPCHVAVHGNVCNVLEALDQKIDLKRMRDHSGWQGRISEWKTKHPLSYLPRGVKGTHDNISPRYITEQIGEMAGEDAILVTDVGQHQMWAAQYYPCRHPRNFLTSAGLGTMGYGFPAAIGAKFAFPDRPVVLISGDGGFQMNIQELTTAVSHKLHIVIAMFDNQALGMVRQWQNLFHGRRYSSVDLHDNPDFVKIVEAFGGKGRNVHDPEKVRDALEEAFAADGPFLLRFILHNDENVFPIVPAGAGLDEAIGGQE